MNNDIPTNDNDINITFYENYIENILATIETLPFNTKDKAIKHVFLLLSSSIELLDNMLYLSQNHSKIGIPILLRVILEASVDIQYILINKENYKKLDFEDVKLWKDLIEETFNGNIHTVGLREMSDFENLSKTIKSRYKELASQNISKSSISTRFKETILADSYNSIYAMLCSYTHNGCSALFDRHSNLEDQVFLFKPSQASEYEQYLKMGSSLIFRCIESINLAFKYNIDEKISVLKNYLAQKNILPSGQWHL